MTLVKFDNKSFILSSMYAHKRELGGNKAFVLVLVFGRNGGSITYAVSEKHETKVKMLQKAVAYIESKLQQDVAEINLTSVLQTLDNLGFTEVESEWDNFIPNGVVVRDLKRQSKVHVEGIFVKYGVGERINYEKVSASGFSVSSYGQTTSDATIFRLYVNGAISKSYPTIEYLFNVPIFYLEDEKYSKTGIRAECRSIIEKLAETNGVVDLDEVERILRPSFKTPHISRMLVMTTYN